MSNTCERCGGQKTFYIEVKPVYDESIGSYRPPVVTLPKQCMCSPIKEKHDGRLDEDGRYEVSHRKGRDGQTPFVAIDGTTSAYIAEDLVWLTPAQALSLLAWLEQERGTLEELAQEQAE